MEESLEVSFTLFIDVFDSHRKIFNGTLEIHQPCVNQSSIEVIKSIVRFKSDRLFKLGKGIINLIKHHHAVSSIGIVLRLIVIKSDSRSKIVHCLLVVTDRHKSISSISMILRMCCSFITCGCALQTSNCLTELLDCHFCIFLFFVIIIGFKIRLSLLIELTSLLLFLYLFPVLRTFLLFSLGFWWVALLHYFYFQLKLTLKDQLIFAFINRYLIYLDLSLEMIHQIWNKKITAIVQMNIQDVADDIEPLPLVMKMAWNHYIGYYFQMINEFFFSYLPFPVNQKQLWLELKQSHIQVKSSQIVGVCVGLNNLDLKKPITFVAHFRSQKQPQEIQLQRFFKNSLKASTAMRYGKEGAKRLTFNMSVNNVKTMYAAFQQLKLQNYLGSQDFQSDDLGYSFLIANSDVVPIKILSNDFLIQRKGQKSESLKKFIAGIIKPSDEEIEYQKLFDILPIKLHSIVMKNGEVLIKDLEKYCHPDGYLYFTI